MIAAVTGIIIPATLVADACGLSSVDRTLMIQVSLILAALATLLQLFPIFRRIGSDLFVIMGINFTYIPTLQATGGEFGPSVILSAEIVGGIVAIVLRALVRWVRPLFPPLVTDTVIFTIGLSLYPTTMRYMAGSTGSEWFGSTKSWAVAPITLAVVVFLNHFTKSITELASILIGILADYIITYFLGIVDLSGMGSAVWVTLPRPMPFDIQSVPTACVSLGIVYVVNAVQIAGDPSSTTMGDMDRMPTDKGLFGDIVGWGVMSILGAFFGDLPAATYSQDMDIITVNRVISRTIFTLATFILPVAGPVPKSASLLTTIPQCVIGGATTSVFAAITMTNIHIITEGDFTPRKSSVVGLSVALDVGITQVSGYLAGKGFPAWVNTVFGSSSVMMTALTAILFDLILPKEPSAGG